jgi:hypothetical protein
LGIFSVTVSPSDRRQIDLVAQRRLAEADLCDREQVVAAAQMKCSCCSTWTTMTRSPGGPPFFARVRPAQAMTLRVAFFDPGRDLHRDRCVFVGARRRCLGRSVHGDLDVAGHGPGRSGRSGGSTEALRLTATWPWPPQVRTQVFGFGSRLRAVAIRRSSHAPSGRPRWSSRRRVATSSSVNRRSTRRLWPRLGGLASRREARPPPKNCLEEAAATAAAAEDVAELAEDVVHRRIPPAAAGRAIDAGVTEAVVAFALLVDR